MNTAWALFLLLVAPFDDTTTPPPPEPVSHLIPESLTRLLTERPEFNTHHLGYLRELARLPDLAESETSWWQVSSMPALRSLAAHFEEALATDNTAQYRFRVFYEALSKSPELRARVEHLVRVELENARLKPELSRALQFLRANPDIALRYLENPARVRPLPQALVATHGIFEQQAEWRETLFRAYDDVAQTPDAHLVVFPWWRQLAALTAPADEGNLDAALYRHPHQYWLWHLRNMNLASDGSTAPWIRYWRRLIQREPDLAREYGPFISKILAEPEQLRQHLIELTQGEASAEEGWPPASDPPTLPPLVIEDSAEQMRRGMRRPEITYPKRPTVEKPPRPDGPQRPERPTAPARPAVPAR